MVAYVLSDGAGRYIRKDNGSGKYVSVKGEKYALQFQTSESALKILCNSIPKTIRDSFGVEEIVVEDVKTTKNMDVVKNIVNKNIVDTEISTWLTKVDAFIELTENVEARIVELVELLSTTDKEICDIQHYIEFGSLNAYQGWLATSMLQNRLRQRRKYKDELAALNLIKSCKIDSKSIENLHKAVDGLGERKYSPRVLSELFPDAK